jgi:hypothetical protein
MAPLLLIAVLIVVYAGRAAGRRWGTWAGLAVAGGTLSVLLVGLAIWLLVTGRLFPWPAA